MNDKPLPHEGETLIAVGKLVGCFGVKGLLKLQPLSDHVRRFEELEAVYLGRSPDRTETYKVHSVESKGKGIVISFESIPDRTQAEPLVGSYVFVSEKNVVKPDKGSYFVDDIIGCSVETEEGKNVGTIKEVYRLPGQDLWEVQTPTGTVMLPAAKEFITGVDLETRRITVRVIDGLFGPE